MAVTRERKDVTAGMRKPEEKVPFWRIHQGASSRLDFAGEAATCRGGGLARQSWASWARSQEKIKIELDFKFQRIWKFGKTWRNSTRRFRRNLDMGIFPKFF
jgi:hypothetical protein